MGMFRFTTDCSWESSGTTLSSVCVCVCVRVCVCTCALSRVVAETKLRFLTLAGPEELTLQALSPKQRDYRVFIDKTVVGNTS